MGSLVLGSEAERRFDPITFPETKAAVEKFILDCAFRSAKKFGVRMMDIQEEPKQNAENHFDFTLKTTKGIEYLDLVEIIPSSWVGGPHSYARGGYNIGEFADAIYSEIEKKSRHYGKQDGIQVNLLLYVTESNLTPHPPVLDLLSFLCSKRDLGFRSIWVYIPDNQETGQIRTLFPTPDGYFQTFDETLARNRGILMADFSTAKPADSGGFVVKLSPILRNTD